MFVCLRFLFTPVSESLIKLGGGQRLMRWYFFKKEIANFDSYSLSLCAPKCKRDSILNIQITYIEDLYSYKTSEIFF